MSNGRTAAGARRSVVALVLGWLAALGAGVLLAPAASAAATVTIGKTAPAPLSLKPGDTVTFVNGIAPLPVTVPGVVPVKATALTDVVLGGPCGGRTLAPGASYAQSFSQTSTCSIGYVYSVQGAPLATVQALLPPLPSPTSLLVTVVQAATSAVSSAVPPPPPAPAPAPGGGLPAPVPGGGAVGGSGGGSVGSASGGSGGGTTVVSGGSGSSAGAVPGATAASPGTSVATPHPAPVDTAAATAFDPARFISQSGLRSAGRSGPGSGTLPGSYDRSVVPVLGQLAGVGSPRSSSSAPGAAPAASSGGAATTLPIAALAAVVALSGVFAALVRTHLAARAAR